MKVVARSGVNLTPQQTIRMKKLYDLEAVDVMSAGGKMEPFEDWVKSYMDAEEKDMETGFEKATGVKKMRREQDGR